MKRLRLFHFDIKTYGNYGDTLLFEAVKQSFNGFAGGEAFEIYDSRPLRDPVGPALVNYINDNFDAVVVGGAACSCGTPTPTSAPAGSGTSPWSTCSSIAWSTAAQ